MRPGSFDAILKQIDLDMSRMTPPVNENSALFLDIDGTLLDMARTPDAVVVPADLRTSLARLHDELRGALAFVSGRSLVDHRPAVRAARTGRDRLSWRRSARR